MSGSNTSGDDVLSFEAFPADCTIDITVDVNLMFSGGPAVTLAFSTTTVVGQLYGMYLDGSTSALIPPIGWELP